MSVMNNTYNLTQLGEVETVLGLFQFANDTTTGLMMGLFMVAVFFVMLIVLKKWEFQDALLSSSFVCFVLSAFATYADLLPFLFPLAFLIIAAFTAFYVFMTKR